VVLHKILSLDDGQYLSICGGERCGQELGYYQAITNMPFGVLFYALVGD